MCLLSDRWILQYCITVSVVLWEVLPTGNRRNFWQERDYAENSWASESQSEWIGYLEVEYNKDGQGRSPHTEAYGDSRL